MGAGGEVCQSTSWHRSPPERSWCPDICLHFISCLLFSPGDSVWTGSFYVLREDGSLSSYASKDIQGQTPVKVIAKLEPVPLFNSLFFCVFLRFCFGGNGIYA